MQNGKPYILFCAGEDSGDCIGESLVKQFYAVGSGGVRMQNAGLVPLIDFEDLPVSGFGDVLPKYWRLRKNYKILENALRSKDCVGLVAIDYPGFNMKLVKVAKKLGKPIFYVAPPQIWAWKSYRAKVFADYDKIQLAVFFDFEVDAYGKAGCNAVKVIHPYAETACRCSNEFFESREKSIADKILLLPGSRKSQALRNIQVFLDVAERCVESDVLQNKKIVLLAARKSLIPVFEKAVEKWKSLHGINRTVVVVESPKGSEERRRYYASSAVAISAPGTATLELALAGCPTVVCTKPDFLTAFFAKRSLKTKYFALPNLILQREVFPEFILEKKSGESCERIAESVKKKATILQPSKEVSFKSEILQKLKSNSTSEKLMSEFFAQFF